LLDQAAQMVDHFLALERDLVAGKDDLDALWRAVPDLVRNDVVKPIFPPQIAEAINPIEPWRAGRVREEGLRH
jgi:hypothetical protein